MKENSTVDRIVSRIEKRIRENVKTNNSQYEAHGEVPEESEGFMRGITWCREMIRSELKK